MHLLKPLLVCLALIVVIDQTVGRSTRGGFKIYNSREVTPHEYPWTGWLLIGQRRVKCGATLIASNFALTAASCASADVVASKWGYHSRESLDGHEEDIGISEIIAHPDYNATTFENDIALLRLDGDVNITVGAIETIPVLPDDQITDRVLQKHCRAVGWGYEVAGVSSRIRDQSDVLLEVVVDMSDNATCMAEMAPANSVCYEPFRDPTSLTCEGDIGGPFFCKRKRVWTLAGVLSGWNVGEGCTNGTRAATVVSHYIDWMDSIINP